LASDGRIVAVVTVPAGSYVVSAWVGFSALDATAGQVVACYLPDGTGGIDAAEANTGTHGEGTLAFHSTFVATEPDTIIRMECRTAFAFLTVAVREVRLTAVRVRSLSVQ
jgi:hypothetical protein